MSATSGRGGAPFVSNFFRSRRRRMRTLPLVQQSRWGDLDDAEIAIMSDWMWDTTTTGSTTGSMKAYTGTGWDAKPVKVWNGSSWITKPAKVWNGSAWIQTNY